MTDVEFPTAKFRPTAGGAFTESELRADPALWELVADDPITMLLLTGQAATASEAERKFLNDNVEMITEQVLELVASNLSEDELSLHPLTMLLRGHGSRHWEDSLL
ncbi:MAG: hypothetical protein ABI977_32330 [Acidobacteriota bacterium]